MDTTAALATLRACRADAYARFRYRADALFELTDALLTASPAPSPAHLRLAPAPRRGWGSTYAALAHGRMTRRALRDLLARHPLADGPPIYAVDVSVWARCAAETSPARGYYYHPSRHSAGQPLVAGGAYPWLTPLSLARASWTAPLDGRRVRPGEDAHSVAAAQIKEGARPLPADGPVPLFVFDAGYDSGQLALDLGEARVATLVRLRKNRCVDADPAPAAAAPTGRPRRPGRPFSCADPAPWPLAPTHGGAHARGGAEQDGRGRVRAGAALHAIPQNHAPTGTRGPTPVVRGTLVRVEVERLPRQTRKPTPLWLWGQSPDGSALDLALLWRAYVRRFDQEHTVRFCKQILTWTTPRVRDPAQADRWTGLVLLADTQLRLARSVVADRRLPWERRLDTRPLTPYRVRRALCTVLPLVGTPATPPQPCGRSPGRPKGARSGPAPRYPALKTAA